MSEQQWTVTSYDGDYHEVRNEVSGEQVTCDTRLSADKVCTALNTLAGIPDPAAALAQAREALEETAKLIPLARRQFPKSVSHSDRFALEVTCAAVAKALAALGGAV